jgi:hypothetical protein
MYLLFSLQACSISFVSGWFGTFIPDLTAATDGAGLGRTIV